MAWQSELKKGICTVEQLKEYIELTPKEEKQLQKVIERHPMRITRYYISLIDRNDPNDPIRKMVVPSEEEFNLLGSYDTSGERKNTKMPGLQHKYSQTALILATNRCASYCRFCFRKRLVGLSTEEILRRFNDSVEYVQKHKEINNVLVSGGDPFVLPTKVIKKFLGKLSAISHLDFIRFGTRIPVTFPDRILEDKELLALLKNNAMKKRICVVTHYNHPREITQKSKNAVDSLINSGIIINNQTVLLNGVNDNPEVLAELQNKLVSIGVNPYYVFQCRPVKRVKHNFQVPLHRGYEIIENAKKMLNGHSKRFRYIMSHKTGKIEIVGVMGDYIYLKYHQAKSPKNTGKFFKRKINKTAGWLDDLG
jgi:lysine 2,3-aminomutase